MAVGETEPSGLPDPSRLCPNPRPADDPSEDPLAELPPASGIRPYLLTGGRTGSGSANFEIEAQLTATPQGHARLDHLVFERRDIVALCQQPTAIVEIAAQLNLHLGVVRVLVGDLAAGGYLSARRPEGDLNRNASIIERVIRGLQAIR